jgi:hypothetical protein
LKRVSADFAVLQVTQRSSIKPDHLQAVVQLEQQQQQGDAGATDPASSAAAPAAPVMQVSSKSSSSQQPLQPRTLAEELQLLGIQQYVSSGATLPGSDAELYNIPWALADRFRLFGTEFADKPKEKEKEKKEDK